MEPGSIDMVELGKKLPNGYLIRISVSPKGVCAAVFDEKQSWHFKPKAGTLVEALNDCITAASLHDSGVGT